MRAERRPSGAQSGPVSAVAPLGTAPAPLEARQRRRARFELSLFWRTFIMLALLLVGSSVAWMQTFRALEYEPRAVLAAQQVASLVNLTRAALVHSDGIARLSLIKELATREGVRIVPREPNDRYTPYRGDAMEERIARELGARLGSGTLVASSVNGERGLWVGFDIDGDAYWLLMDPARLRPVGGETWLIWLATAAALSLVGAAFIARLINQPLKKLSFAASRVRDGDFDASHLDERAVTSEIREVNIGFNRMAAQLAKIEQDRAVMLAGISHDLRTPLARLRLEAEMSVADPDAREHMIADIAQLDAIIDKFLEYARPGQAELRPVSLSEIVEACIYPFKDAADIAIALDIPAGIRVMADEVELARVLSNLIENARRYGKSPETGVARVDIGARVKDDEVHIKVRDHGMGVAPELLDKLTKPFFRGDAARTAATGAGLGLSIVAKTVERMGGRFSLKNSSTGGLAAFIVLHRAA
ncbi:sensor histidine kinase [Tibeticola sp.]|uniref:sensor histidine kinase n=1 Tax=Tibeticola sp. TaxID=2005368 RepID=UPI002582B4A8|nr:sensor histidine kinase [Tibeticola sp.]MCI4439914.1 HAMP domain-containing protein [Tibeticola sp.]